ncbi:MAG: hypothetical protein O3B73_09735 [bacterium]|nr:hypothetical protein [bacterium]
MKQLVVNALDDVLPEPILRVDAPSTMLATVTAQPAQNRCVVHLLHYIPERRGQDFDVIEDVIPIYEVGVSVRVAKPVTGVETAPGGQTIPFAQADGRVVFVLPKLDGHEMVVLTF